MTKNASEVFAGIELIYLEEGIGDFGQDKAVLILGSEIASRTLIDEIKQFIMTLPAVINVEYHTSPKPVFDIYLLRNIPGSLQTLRNIIRCRYGHRLTAARIKQYVDLTGIEVATNLVLRIDDPVTNKSRLTPTAHFDLSSIESLPAVHRTFMYHRQNDEQSRYSTELVVSLNGELPIRQWRIVMLEIAESLSLYVENPDNIGDFDKPTQLPIITAYGISPTRG